MAVWLGLGAIVPVGVRCKVVIIFVVSISFSVQSVVFSSLGLFYFSFFALIVESRLNIFLWLGH